MRFPILFYCSALLSSCPTCFCSSKQKQVGDYYYNYVKSDEIISLARANNCMQGMGELSGKEGESILLFSRVTGNWACNRDIFHLLSHQSVIQFLLYSPHSYVKMMQHVFILVYLHFTSSQHYCMTISVIWCRSGRICVIVVIVFHCSITDAAMM